MTRLIADVRYTGDPAPPLSLDILRPDPLPAAPMPLVMELHPGAWMFGGKHAERNKMLAEQGFATASVDYRPSTTAPFPAQIDDVRAAVHFLRAHAAEYHLDPDRFGIWGESSGGHLAALLGTAGERRSPCQPATAPLVQAVAAISAPVDLAVLNHEYGPPLLGGPLPGKRKLAVQASPLPYITGARGLPPFLIVHGSGDRQVPPEHADLLRTALEAAGAKVEYVILNAGHNLLGSEYAAQCQALLVEFFTACLQGRPQVCSQGAF
jgi:acetyl esterase/lipase